MGSESEPYLWKWEWRYLWKGELIVLSLVRHLYLSGQNQAKRRISLLFSKMLKFLKWLKLMSSASSKGLIFRVSNRLALQIRVQNIFQMLVLFYKKLILQWSWYISYFFNGKMFGSTTNVSFYTHMPLWSCICLCKLK